jgi:hypothetical protein
VNTRIRIEVDRGASCWRMTIAPPVFMEEEPTRPSFVESNDSLLWTSSTAKYETGR